MSASIRIAMLGPVRVWRDGGLQPAGSPQQQAVPAALLLRDGHPASLVSAA
ncbi:hypothetical protein [Catenuloplanes japonicus]|uniref:hypothetical protein n=1 Tax=Catenuloplanes japonicus TaxID=33876 RepID=UPI000A643272|nr:hypothetical protein [Catenuloplanes japonicus]